MKKITQDEIDRAKKEYLASGGTIQKLEPIKSDKIFDYVWCSHPYYKWTEYQTLDQASDKYGQ